MTTYYISTSGSDSNPGTSTGQPFRTINRGLNALSSGDTLSIGDGSYAERISNESGGSNIPSGSSGSPTIIKTTSGVRGGVSIRWTGLPTSVALINLHWIVIQDLIIDCQDQPTAAEAHGVVIGANNFADATNISLLNVEVKNAVRSGFAVDGSSHRIISCWSHDNGVRGISVGQTGSGVYLQSQNTLVELCILETNSGAGITGKDPAGGSFASGCTIRRNIIRNNTQYSIVSRATAMFCINNIIYGNGTSAPFDVITLNSSSTFYNNTVYSNSGRAIIAESGPVRNNICYQNGTNTITGTGTITHNLLTDPSFVNAAGGNFKLQSGSAAIDTGTDLSSTGFTTDFDGAARPFGSAWDIGAYEFGSSPGGGGDVTPPSITITSPASDPHGTTTTPITVSGTASDNVAVVSVTWSNSAGGSGTATGTTSWSASIALAEGANVITVTARDAANNTATDSVTINKSGGGGGAGEDEDVTPPTITITSPTSSTTYGTNATPITISGTASDETELATVIWVNDRGGSGVATGTTSWSFIASLFSGVNNFTVTATDTSDNTSFDTLAVTYAEVTGGGGTGTGEVRNTQIPVEVAIEPTDVQAQVSQFYAEAIILPDTNIRVSQQVIEIISNIPDLIELSGGLALSGTLTLAIEDSPVEEWFRARVKKLIYLVRLELRWATSSVNTEYLYLSNHTYNTVANDDPANTEYIAVLEDQSIPAFRQDLSEVFFGLSIPSYGKLVIHNADGQFDAKLPINRVWRGGEVLIKLTGDRTELPLTSAITIMRGIMGKVVYSDNTIAVETFSSKRLLEKKEIPTATFEGVNGDEVPEPVLYGYGSNISPILKDEVNQIYKVASSLTAIDAVYDTGVLLSPSQYSVNLAAGEFTLTPNPAGQITVDARGKAINGVFSAKRGDFIYDLLTTYGEIPVIDIDGASFSQFNVDIPGDSGIYINAQTSINDIIEQLLRPVMGYLFFSRTGVAFIGRLTLPTDSDPIALEITEKHFISEGDPSNDDAVAGDIVSIEEADLLYYKVTMNYDRNYTVMDENSLGDADPVDSGTPDGLARREYLSKEWRETVTELSGTTVGKNLYLEAGELGPLDSYFRNKSDADNAAQHWLDIFGVCRRLVRVRCKTSPLQTTLGATIRMTYWVDGLEQYRWLNNTLGKAVSYSESYADNSVGLTLLV